MFLNTTVYDIHDMSLCCVRIPLLRALRYINGSIVDFIAAAHPQRTDVHRRLMIAEFHKAIVVLRGIH